MIVVDASVLANAIGDDGPEGGRAREELVRQGELAAPDMADIETVSVLRKRWLAGSLTDRRFALAIGDLTDLDIARYPSLPFMKRAYELRSTVTVYDASYVALAEALDCELLTSDVRLSNAPGVGCPICVLR